MKNTKQLILDTSLMLFNDKGLTDTTLRNIARKMEISQGNLNYHYKLKEEIVAALYFQLVEKMDERMQALNLSTSTLALFYQSAHAGITQMYDYRFILMDFLKIMNENPVIKKHYVQLQMSRKQQFLSIFDQLVQSKLMRPADFKNEFSRLYERLNIMGDYWINAYSLHADDSSKPIGYYIDLLFESIYPYLTATGKAEYRSILNHI